MAEPSQNIAVAFDAPVTEDLVERARDFLAAARTLTLRTRQPDDAEANIRANTFAMSMQALLREAGEGHAATDEELQMAFAITLGWWMNPRDPAERLQFLSQFATACFRCAKMTDEAFAQGMPTVGSA